MGNIGKKLKIALLNIIGVKPIKEVNKVDIKEEYKKGTVQPTPIEGTNFFFLRKANKEEKPINTNKGYSWYLCSCGEIIIRRNDSTLKQCNCNKNRGKRKITLEERKEIAEYYKKKPISYQEVCEKFKVSAPTVEKIIKQFNIKPWNKAQLFSPNIKEDYFNNIDTDEKGYFLGLLITDGNIYNGYKSKTHQTNVNITLQNEDRYILEELKKVLCLNKNITEDGRGCSQLSIMSSQMAEDLKQYGIVPKKTFSARFPFNVPKQYYNSVFRGILDGDGSIAFYSRPGKRVHTKRLSICSANKVFLEDLQLLLEQTLGVKPNHIYQEKENLWSISYGSKESLEKIINWMYEGSSIYLKRKKEKCDLILQEISKYRDN